MAFQAKYGGRCRACNQNINPGDDILRMGKSHHIHAKCATPQQLAEDIAKDMEWKTRQAELGTGPRQNAPQEPLGDQP